MPGKDLDCIEAVLPPIVHHTWGWRITYLFLPPLLIINIHYEINSYLFKTQEGCQIRQ